jgi:hypothetical protein
VDLTFQGALRPDQQVAADAILAHDTGVLAQTLRSARRLSAHG